MLPRLSLLDELRGGGFEASLITTFNAYLPFYEDVVLRRLINAGVRHNLLLMDAQQFRVSLQNHPPRLAGRKYTLAPIAVPGAFHPKLIFLVGKQKGLLIVGSHNMTLAGFGFNRELTNVIPISVKGTEAGVAIATQTWSEIVHWIETSSENIPQKIRDSVFRFKDFAPWLSATASNVDTEVRLLAGRADGPSLWEQLCNLVPTPVKEIFLTGAFFDSKLDFLNRIQADLQPEQTVVALDPKTVEIPPDSKAATKVRFVRATSLGTDADKDSAPGYLHAKGMFLRQQNNDCLFVSGSANPSRPAWLARKSDGNTELMVARLGARAEGAASDLGFLEIPNLPTLDENDWQTIANSSSKIRSVATSNCTVGIAIVIDDKIYIDTDLGTGLKDCTTLLLDADHLEIVRGNGLVKKEEQYVATFNVDHLTQARYLRCELGLQLVALLLLHHLRIVEEQARTGVQKQFREALLSLQTDSPNIESLIGCLNKMALSEDTNTSTMSSRNTLSRRAADDQEDSTPDSLAIDVSDVSRRKSRHRLTHSSDLGYLLDTLIFHLRFQEDRTMDTVDHQGRSEEEQVDADDSEDAEENFLTEGERVAILKLCHAKVRTVVRRMTKHLRAYTELSAHTERMQSLPAVLIRLLSVLAVLRELRRCDGRVPWLDHGKTTVPVDERKRLFEEVMFNLFEPEPSLLHMETLEDYLATSEDIARLKGLLLWLAWDCSHRFEPDKPFMETHEMEVKRLKANAMLLALAQSVQQDGQVIEEAHHCIGGIFSTSNMDWLDALHSLADQCGATKRGESTMRSAEVVNPGDVVVHRDVQDRALRIVASVRDDGIVSMFKLSRKQERDYLHTRYLLSTNLN